jgi:hypothetical protein
MVDGFGPAEAPIPGRAASFAKPHCGLQLHHLTQQKFTSPSRSPRNITRRKPT